MLKCYVSSLRQIETQKLIYHFYVAHSNSVHSGNISYSFIHNRCRKCSYTVSGKSILILLDRLFDELELLDPNSIKDYEAYLKRYANVLHPNHYLILSAKHSLCQLIGRSDGFIINELDLTELQRKEEYCRDLLNVVNVLEPGASRLRGIICYEMHAPMMVKITREFENRTINSNQLRSCLKEVRKK